MPLRRPGRMGTRQRARGQAKHLAAGDQQPVRPKEQPEAEADPVEEAAPPAQKRDEGREAPQEAAAQMARHRGGCGLAPPSTELGANSHKREPPLWPPAISVPVVLPGSRSPIPGLTPVPQTTATGSAGTASLPSLLSDGRPLPPLRPSRGRLGLARHRHQQPRRSAPGAGSLSVQTPVLLALLQVILGCTVVLLNIGVLSLSSSLQLKNACPFWASSLVILCGILGIVIWKKPIMILANLFVLLSVVCVLLNLIAFILGYQGVQFVSSVPRCDLVDVGENKICFCCEEFQPAKCREESVLKLYHVKSCSFALVRLKKLLSALCALSVFATVVCLSAAILHYLQMFTARRSYLGGTQTEDQAHVLDSEDFISPVPPPSYFTVLFSGTPRMSCRAQIRGADVFSSDEPPPPYEAAQSQNSSDQEDAVQASILEASGVGEISDRQSSEDLCYSGNFSNNDIPYYSNEEISESSSSVSLLLSNASLVPAGVGRRSFHPLKKWSKSDPVLRCQLLQGAVLCLESEKENEGNAPLCAVTQQGSLRGNALRGRPWSLVDLTDAKWFVTWITEQSCSMSSDICGLVENIKSAGKHAAEAASSATFLEQVTAPPQEAMLLDAPVLPFRWQPGLHLETCGDLGAYTTNEDQLSERRIKEAEHE